MKDLAVKNICGLIVDVTSSYTMYISSNFGKINSLMKLTGGKFS